MTNFKLDVGEEQKVRLVNGALVTVEYALLTLSFGLGIVSYIVTGAAQTVLKLAAKVDDKLSQTTDRVNGKEESINYHSLNARGIISRIIDLSVPGWFKDWRDKRSQIVVVDNQTGVITVTDFQELPEGVVEEPVSSQQESVGQTAS